MWANIPGSFQGIGNSVTLSLLAGLLLHTLHSDDGMVPELSMWFVDQHQEEQPGRCLVCHVQDVSYECMPCGHPPYAEDVP